MSARSNWSNLTVSIVVITLVLSSFVGPLATQPTVASAQESPPTSSDEFAVETMLSELNQPTSMAFLPDGRMLVTQKGGEIVIAERTANGVQTSTYMEVPEVTTSGERGLLAVTLDPDFESNGHFYVYYTQWDGDGFNRISRFTHDEGAGGIDSSADPSSEEVIWENPNESTNCCHFGGGLDVGPDGRLYLTTGEEFDGEQAQDLSKADGKIIRVNRDGSIPSDNPFVGQSGALDSIWAYGLRNPFRASWDHESDRFFVGEVGGNDDSVAMEDVHIGEKGANYGWPECEGECSDPNFTDPIYSYPHDGSGASITGGVVYRGDQFPSEYQGAYFYGDYVRGWIKYLTFDSNGDVTGSHDFHASDDSIVAIEQGPDGALYYADIAAGTVTRISFDSSNAAPEITDASANVTSGSSPLTVEFTGSATDPDGDSLSYEWHFGDGTSATGQTVTHTYDENGTFTAELQVADGTDTSTSEPIEIVVGDPPSPTITAPTDGSLFRAGDTITFEGEATDPQDGSLSGENLEWTVQFLHDEHTHPAVDAHTGSGGSFEIPTSGHDYSDETGYRITLTATDSDGLSESTSVEVYPDKVDVTIETEPAGMDVELDGIRRTTPITHDTLIGFEHTVTAISPQVEDGTQYEFDGWSDGGAREHTITVPESDTTLTANYNATGDASGLISDGLALHLEADQGVSTSEGDNLTSWSDQSGNGNDLTASGDPMLVGDGTPGGQPAIAFDGSDDVLERSGTNGLPTGSDDRTMFVVARYDSEGFGGVAYGDNRANEAFGLVVDDSGRLTVQGFFPANDFPSDVQGTGAGWLTQSAVVSNDEFVHYQDGTQIDSGTHSFATDDDMLVVGSELTPPPYLDMDVSAVLVYDRALSESEREQVEAYLQEKYFDGTGSEPSNQPPTVAPIEDQTVAENETVTLEVTASDSDGDSIALSLIDSPAFASLHDHGDGTAHLELSPAGGDAGEHTVTVEATDGNLSDDETFELTVTADGPSSEPPTANDDSATVARNGTVSVDVLANDEDPNGDIDASTVTVASGPENGTTSVNGSSGTISYTHDNSSASSDSFTYTVDDEAGNTSNEAVVSITVEQDDGDGDDSAGDDDSDDGSSSSSASSSGGGGGGSGATDSDPSVDVTRVSANEFRALVEDVSRTVPVKIRLPSFDGDAGTGTELTTIRITPGGPSNFEFAARRTGEPPSDTPALEAGSGQSGLAYFTLDHELTDDDVANARLTFRVSKARLDAWGADPASVTIYRYEDDGWASYDTRRVGEDASAYYFSATLPGLSRFAVGADRTLTPTPTETPAATPEDSEGTTTATPSTTTASGGTAEEAGFPLVPILAVVGVIVVVGGLLLYRRRNNGGGGKL